MPNVVNIGGKGGPNIQAPWSSMVSRGMGGGGFGYGGAMSDWRRRLFGGGAMGAGRIDPNMRDPNYRPPVEPFSPYEDKPYGRGEQEMAPQSDMLNIYRGLPGFNPLEMSKDQVPSRFRISSGVGQSSTGFGRLNQLSDAAMRVRGFMGGGRGFGGGGGQGFGEGYPGDALKRLLQARLGGGGF